MPEKTCALMVNPMLQAMLNHLRLNPPLPPYSEEDSKLLDVILDQLVITPSAGSYLPDSKDPVLAKVLSYLKTAQAAIVPLKHWGINSEQRSEP